MICVSLAHITFADLQAVVSELDMIELRLDLLQFSDKEYQQIYTFEKDVIATYRKGNLDDKIRIKALQKQMIWGAKYVDIDINNDIDFIKDIFLLAQQYKCKTILSYHNFEQTPDTKELELLIKKSKQLGADYTKIACMANTQKDVARILSLYENNTHLIAFNMGVIGRISRLASLYLGADFTYASFSEDKMLAEGQFTYKALKRMQDLIK